MALLLRISSLLFFAVGLGFGISAFPVLRYIGRNGDLPVVLGIRAFSGPFERLGLDAFSRLLVAFGVLSLLEVLPGIWIWQGLKKGAYVGMLLSAINLPFWIGFSLPIPLVLGPLRVLLLAWTWTSLKD